MPDPVAPRPLSISGDLASRVATAERDVRRLTAEPGSEALASLARFLLRSEAIASSRIEGIAPSPQQIALAELGQHESVRGISDQARLVANNITVVRRANRELVEADSLAVEHVVDLHRALEPEERHHGLRRVQNWIGGSDWHPIDSAFVPPAPGAVAGLMADLLVYAGGAAHAPIVQAALVHAQFETIHPYTDGNGRVGRALIHTVFTRRGLTPTAVLPVSLVLATLSEAYVSGLMRYRYDGDMGGRSAVAGVEAWVEVFTGAVLVAAEESRRLVAAVTELREDWDRRVAEHRTIHGVRGTPRADSATARLLAVLPEAPVCSMSWWWQSAVWPARSSVPEPHHRDASYRPDPTRDDRRC